MSLAQIPLTDIRTLPRHNSGNQEGQLSHSSESPGAAKGLSLDTWAVALALALALLVRLGVIQKVPW